MRVYVSMMYQCIRVCFPIPVFFLVFLPISFLLFFFLHRNYLSIPIPYAAYPHKPDIHTQNTPRNIIDSNVWQKLNPPTQLPEQYRTILFSSSHHSNTNTVAIYEKEKFYSTLDKLFLIRNEDDDQNKKNSVLSALTLFINLFYVCVCVCMRNFGVYEYFAILTNPLWLNIVAGKSNHPRRWFEQII